MSLKLESQQTQPLAITLELEAEGRTEADLAAVYAVGGEVTMEWQRRGASIQPAKTGKRGGEFLVQIITTTTDLATMAWTNKEIILSDIANLITICIPTVAIIQSLVKAHQQHASRQNTAIQPLKVTLEIDGTSMTIEAATAEQIKDTLQIVQQFSQQHPFITKKATPQSTVKVKGHIPAQPRRKKKSHY